MLPIIIGLLLCFAIYLVSKELVIKMKEEKEQALKEEKLEEVKSGIVDVEFDSVVLDYKEELQKKKKVLERKEKKLNK